MHICFIIETYATRTGLAGNNIHLEAAELVKKGLDVSVITNKLNEDAVSQVLDGVRISRVGCSSSKMYLFLFIARAISAALRINKKQKIDIIHAHWAIAAGFSAVVIAKILHVPSVVTCRGFDINYLKEHPEYGAYSRPLPRFLVRFTLKNINHIICISKSLKENILKLWRIKRNGISVIYPAIANDFFREAPIDRTAMNTPTGVLTVAGLRKIKHIEDILHALYILNNKGINIELRIAGPELDNFQELKDICDKYTVNRMVKFLGHIQQSDLIEIYDNADIYVNVSVLEGFGRTYLEAMARRKPIILTSTVGCAEIIRHMDTGIIIKKNAPDEIAAAIELLIQNRELAQRIAVNGYNFVSQNHRLNNYASRLKEYYCSILDFKSNSDDN